MNKLSSQSKIEKDIGDWSGIHLMFSRWDPKTEVEKIISIPKPINQNPYNIKKGEVHVIFDGKAGKLYALVGGKSLYIGSTQLQGASKNKWSGSLTGTSEVGNIHINGNNEFKAQEELRNAVMKRLSEIFPNDYTATEKEEEEVEFIFNGEIDDVKYTIITNTHINTVSIRFTIDGEEYFIPSVGTEKKGRKWIHYIPAPTGSDLKTKNLFKKNLSGQANDTKTASERFIKKIKVFLSKLESKEAILQSTLDSYRLKVPLEKAKA